MLLILLLLLLFAARYVRHLLVVIITLSRLQLLCNLLHDVDIIPRCRPRLVKLEAFLDLITQFFSVGRVGFVGEGIDTCGNGALVRQVARYPSLVLGFGAADESGVVDESVLGGVSLGFEGAEEGFLGSQDLYGGGQCLGEGC